MNYGPYKRRMLAHCMKWAEIGDPQYAEYSAGRFEKNEPWALTGLKAKVQELIAEQKRQAESLESESDSTSGAAPATTKDGS